MQNVLDLINNEVAKKTGTKYIHGCLDHAAVEKAALKADTQNRLDIN